MMNKHMIEIDNVRGGYIDVVNNLLHHGKFVAPHGIGTFELQSFMIVHQNPAQCIVHGINRNQNNKIGAAEALQLIGGCSDPELMLKVAPRFRTFMDGSSLFGAYGPRIRHQMPTLATKLGNDPTTRQAHVAIWRDSDLLSAAKDIPCTLGFTFHVRNSKLDMHTHMRSNDVWWGFTYDVMQFCTLQVVLAEMLYLDVGTYFHHADSFHIYARDIEAAEKLERPEPGSESQRMEGLGVGNWSRIELVARALLHGPINTHVEHPLSVMLHG